MLVTWLFFPLLWFKFVCLKYSRMAQNRHPWDLQLLTFKSTDAVVKLHHLSSLPLSLLYAAVPATSRISTMIKPLRPLTLVSAWAASTWVCKINVSRKCFYCLSLALAADTVLLWTVSWEQYNNFDDSKCLFSFLSSRHLRGLLFCTVMAMKATLCKIHSLSLSSFITLS